LNQVAFPYALAPVVAVNCQLAGNAWACGANAGKNVYLYQQFKRATSSAP
jgi:hypothetical protein